MSIALVGIDIETDTRVFEADGTQYRPGLNPQFTRIVNAAVAAPWGQWVFESQPASDGRLVGPSEKQLLVSLNRLLCAMPPMLLVSWNGAVFDFPFLSVRAELAGVPLGLRLSSNPDLVPKYAPTPGFEGGVHVAWDNATAVPHAHLDVAYQYRAWAARSEVDWSLKPVARALGYTPVEVDRTRIHELDSAKLREYVLSDATVTVSLAQRLLEP